MLKIFSSVAPVLVVFFVLTTGFFAGAYMSERSRKPCVCEKQIINLNKNKNSDIDFSIVDTVKIKQKRKWLRKQR